MLTNNILFKNKILDKQIENLFLSKQNKPDPNNIALISSAYQSDIIKEYKVIFPKIKKTNKNKIEKKNEENKTNKENQSMQQMNKEKVNRIHYLNKINMSKNLSQKEEYFQKKEFYSKLTLANRIGLKPIENFPLSNNDWKKIETISNSRINHTSCCPICIEKLNSKETVILSCSHVFHMNCIKVFEILNKKETHNTNKCPLCRKSNYYKKRYFKDKEDYVKFSIILIQSYFKSYSLRRRLYETVYKDNMPRNRDLYLRFQYFRLKEIFNSINKKLKVRKKEAVELIENMEKEILIKKKLNSCLEKCIKNKNSQLNDALYQVNDDGCIENVKDNLSLVWNNVIKNSKEKFSCNDNCNICISVFGTKSCKILSCGHIFHSICLASFEKYDSFYKIRCPTCRYEEYNKIEFSFN